MTNTIAVTQPMIRPGVVSDATAIAALIHSLASGFLEFPDGRGTEPFWQSISASEQAVRLTDPRFDYLVAVMEAELVGVIALRDGCHILHLFVAKHMQGQGLASRLWAEARKRSPHTGDFTVNSAPLAVPVYERFGFQRSGERVAKHGVVIQPMVLTGTTKVPVAPEDTTSNRS